MSITKISALAIIMTISTTALSMQPREKRQMSAYSDIENGTWVKVPYSEGYVWMQQNSTIVVSERINELGQTVVTTHYHIAYENSEIRKGPKQ